MANEALLVIDMLGDFVRKGAPLEVPETRKIIPAIRREIEQARAAGNPVIYVCDSHAPDDEEFARFGWPAHGVKGTEGSKVVAELQPREGDIVIEKTTYSAFYKTRLESILKEKGIDTVRITGTVTHICVLFAAYEAVLYGYGAVIVGDAVAGIEKDDHDAALRIMKNVLRATIV